MQYVLDTNICIYIAKQSPPEVLEKFSSLRPGSLGMSLVIHGELLYGAYLSQNSVKAQNILEELAAMISVIPLGKAAIAVFVSAVEEGKVRFSNPLITTQLPAQCGYNPNVRKCPTG